MPMGPLSAVGVVALIIAATYSYQSVASSAGPRLALEQYPFSVFNFQVPMDLGPYQPILPLTRQDFKQPTRSRISTVEDDIGLHYPLVDKWLTARSLNVAVLVARLTQTVCRCSRVKVVLCRPLSGRSSTILVFLYF